MISYVSGNILDANADVLVNTVNAVGVMGKGIALQFKKHYPMNYEAYRNAVKQGIVKPGKVFLYPINTTGKVKYIANFATKGHWRYPSQLRWIKTGLEDLKKQIAALNIDSVAIPPLGCGQGGLDWRKVKVLIEDELKDLPLTIYAYEPSNSIRETLKEEPLKKIPKLTPVRAMLLYLFYRYQILGEDITEFVGEKLSYFLYRTGEARLKLAFKEGYYGPYSGQVRNILFAVNGYYIKGFEQMDVKPFDPLELVFERKDEVDSYVKRELSDTERERIYKVEKLINGFETPYGLELLASVDYINQKYGSANFNTIRMEIGRWSQRKNNMFTDEHIQLALKLIKERF